MNCITAWVSTLLSKLCPKSWFFWSQSFNSGCLKVVWSVYHHPLAKFLRVGEKFPRKYISSLPWRLVHQVTLVHLVPTRCNGVDRNANFSRQYCHYKKLSKKRKLVVVGVLLSINFYYVFGVNYDTLFIHTYIVSWSIKLFYAGLMTTMQTSQTSRSPSYL